MVVEMAAILAAVLGVAIGAQLFLVTPWAVAGRSMRPTLEPGDHLLVDRWTLTHRAPRIGELVLLLGPDGRPMCKRVARPPRGAAAGRIWVLGDNPADSSDSREFGAVQRERLLGRVAWRYWPPARAGRVR